MKYISLLLISISVLNIKSFFVDRLTTFKKKHFYIYNEYYIFEYSNNVEMRFGGGAIFFIFDKGYKASTNLYLYDSYNKIEKGNSGFINYLHKSSLKETKYFQINDKDTFFKLNVTYYLVLYDISERYDDFIYVVNTLDFFPLYDYEYFSFFQTIQPQLNFNFKIPKQSEGYLHYQTSKDPFNVLGTSDFYYFRIKDNNGTTFIDQQTSGVNGYIKLNQDLEYYIQIAIRSSGKNVPSCFILSFSEYGENFWLKDNDISLDILSAQHYSFFKNISNLNISDSFTFKGNIRLGSFADCYCFIKYYDNDDFESVHEEYPSRKEEFDKEISCHRGEFQIEIKKFYDSQKGILLGVFFDSSYLMMEHSYLTIYGDKRNNENEDKRNNEKEDYNYDENNSKKGKNSYWWVYCIISIIVLIVIYICCKNCCCSKNGTDTSIVFGYKVEATFIE